MILSLNSLVKIKQDRKKKSTRFASSHEYWQARARKFGKRAVISIDHSDKEFDLVKNRDRDVLFPILKKHLTGHEQLVLDFGCGSGRFTSDLAQLINAQAIGVDPTSELIKLAPKAKKVKYLVIKNNHIPLPDESVDVIWIYAVLGCVSNNTLAATLKSLTRVLKRNGVFFMTENTSSAPNSDFYTYRSAEEYIKSVPNVPMKHVHDYYDIGTDFNERFSVMVGNKV